MDFLMDLIFEQILVYGTVFLLCAITVFFYLKKKRVQSNEIEKKVAIAKEEGLFEPVSLHP